jgi:serine/threonine protein phosphatase PrpC
VSLLVRKGSTIYSANVGNCLAFVFFSEKIFSYKFDVRQLTYDNSNFSSETLDENNLSKSKNNNDYISDGSMLKGGVRKNSNSEINRKNNKHSSSLLLKMNSNKNPNLEEGQEKISSKVKKLHVSEEETMGNEIRRIYEKSGEIRNLAGENVSRIFLKGKYYPGLLNTRSLGDIVGRDIGIISEPHIIKYHCNEKLNYYLILCSDGISNTVSVDKMINIIESNDLCKFFLYLFYLF